jgi:hypothetical protein
VYVLAGLEHEHEVAGAPLQQEHQRRRRHWNNRCNAVSVTSLLFLSLFPFWEYMLLIRPGVNWWGIRCNMSNSKYVWLCYFSVQDWTLMILNMCMWLVFPQEHGVKTRHGHRFLYMETRTSPCS